MATHDLFMNRLNEYLNMLNVNIESKITFLSWSEAEIWSFSTSPELGHLWIQNGSHIPCVDFPQGCANGINSLWVLVIEKKTYKLFTANPTPVSPILELWLPQCLISSHGIVQQHCKVGPALCQHDNNITIFKHGQLMGERSNQWCISNVLSYLHVPSTSPAEW